jgi:class 3 adenylate cyclase/tetratricopeptide (TPR) repeat protein
MPKVKVFLSYGREDETKAKRLYDVLLGFGYDVWFDRQSIQAGERWKVVILQAVRSVDVVVILLSRASSERRGFIHQEIREALDVLDELPDSRRFLIPVRLDAFEPPHHALTKLQWVNMFPSWEDGVLRIKKAIEAIPTAVSPAHDAAERRQLTIMFCGLVGPIELSTRFDPEKLREILNAYHGCCTELIEREGGYVAQDMGDAVLAYFGYPQAHEDYGECAVRAGLALVAAVPQLTLAADLFLQVRVGIATGLMVVGDLIGVGVARGLAIGETSHLARSLQEMAEGGAVVIASDTRRLIGELFEYRDLGTVALKGFVKKVRAWQVLGASAAESRFEALRAATTPLVGRSEEIELLQRRWEQAKRGDGQVVLISGESGIGKSRIAQTVLERISTEPHTRLRYFCSPHHQDSALYPSIAQLERAAGFRRDDSNEQRLNKLEKLLAQGTNELGEAVPLLAELVSIPTGGRYPPLNLSPQKRKEKTLQAQLAQLEGLARRLPVLILFEDVHWSDPTTRESLHLLIERMPSLRVLLIITFRPEFTPPWIGLPHVTILNLNRLSKRQRAEMITYVGGGKELPKEIADQIVDRTDGVPLFIEELTKAVVESGVLAETGEGYPVSGPMAPLAIPTTLHGSLLARLDRLASTREVAQIGAALGRSFSHELISAVATMPKPQLDDALAQLIDAELIFRRGAPPDAEYTFKHALVQDAAYSTLLRRRRQQLHGRIAATLETQFSEFIQTQPEVLARHCAEAGLVEKAVGYWLKAGQLAIARSAMTEAVAQLGKGLEFLVDTPDGVVRQEHELRLQVALGSALIATKGFAAPATGEAYDRARELCERSNQSQQLIGPILRGQYTFRLLRGDLQQAAHHAEEISHLGHVWDEPMWKCIGSVQSGNVCVWLGRFIDGHNRYQEALSLWDPKFRVATAHPTDPYLALLLYDSRSLLFLGYLDQARLRRCEALTESKRLSLYNRAFALTLSWVGHWTIEDADEVLALANEQGFADWGAIGALMRGWCLSTRGQGAEGVPLMLQGLDTWRATGGKLVLPSLLTALADAYGMAGQPQEGVDRLTEAAILIETTQERWIESEMHRVRGTLLRSMGEHDAAEHSYGRALAVAREQSARFFELRAGLSLAWLWRDQGKRTKARDLLSPIYSWFTEGLDAPVLEVAKALLDELA